MGASTSPATALARRLAAATEAHRTELRRHDTLEAWASYVQGAARLRRIRRRAEVGR